MTWQNLNFDWNQARGFLATAEAGSLSAAARDLGLTQPTLSRQVAALEAALGVVLFERIGRSLVLTPGGMDLLEHFRAMGAAAGHIALIASRQGQGLEGSVSITASDAFSAYFVPPVLKRLREIAPGIEVEVIAANDLRDLQRREADIAVRHVRPTQAELIARLVCEWTAHLYAATEYLEAAGRPVVAGDLAGRVFIGFAPVDRLILRLNRMGLALVRDQFRYVTDNGIVAGEMIRQGLGIGVMPRPFAAHLPGVEMVLPDLPPIEVPFWLTCHKELLTSRRIRLVYDLLAEELERSGQGATRRTSGG